MIASVGILPLECINPVRQKYKVRWDFRKIDDQNVSFEECDFDHKPTLEEIKTVILNRHNQEIDKKILSGFVWRDIPVWLSSENQFNYKAAFDLAAMMQGQGGTLPVTFKLGTDEEPVYFEFTDIETFTDFYTSSIAYVNQVLNEGWQKKEALDWEVYTNLLNEF